MSWGICICSVCKHEVHQSGPRDAQGRTKWQHCEGRTPICPDAQAVYPHSEGEIKGKWCGVDGAVGLL
jgi:hypothetical protein